MAKSFFLYKDNQDYIDQQARRARAIKYWLFILLGLSFFLYLFFHLWAFDPPEELTPFNWIRIDTDSGISKRALDWVLFSIIGTLIYLLTEIAKNFPNIISMAEKKEPSFIEYTPWYATTLVKGPFIAVIILLFFYTAEFKLTGDDGSLGLNLDFSELDHRATVLLASVLGFYSRVARTVLDNIMKSLFSKAWAEAHDEFEIDPGSADVILGASKAFQTSPHTDVVWAASAGTIGTDGVYKAPTEESALGTTAMITAVSKGATTITHSAVVNIVPFTIVGDEKVTIGSQEPYNYHVEPAESNELEWKLSPKDAGKILAGNYTPPTAEEVEAKSYRFVTITATNKKKKNRSNSKVIELIEKKAA
jgi:hypothetical protein